MKLTKLAFAILTIATMLTTTSCNNSTSGDSAPAVESNQALDAIYTRTSVRQYDASRAIAKDTVDMILRAAMSAPTAVNRQPWAFVVIDKREILDSLAEGLPYAKMLKHAPLAIIPCGDLDKALEGDGQAFWIQDVSAATENMLIAAHALGLGAVWTGVYPDMERVNDVRKVLGMPDEIIPLCVVPMGYPDGAQTPKDKWDENKVRYNKW